MELTYFAFMAYDLATLLVSRRKGIPRAVSSSKDYLAPGSGWPDLTSVPSISITKPTLLLFNSI